MNAGWHKKHPMPKNATLEQRMVWHKGHAKYCACRPVPARLRVAIKARQAGKA